jgi:hypothetical protein
VHDTVHNLGGAAFGRFLADETAKWTRIIQSLRRDDQLKPAETVT